MTDMHTLQSPVEAARLFRRILTAFSKPATPVAMPACPLAPAPLLPATAAVLLSLCDYQTPVWLSPSLDVAQVRKFIRFRTGASVTGLPNEAAFAVSGVDEAPSFMGQFALGTDEYPDRSATLVLQTEQLSSAHGVTVTGPGLQQSVSLSVAGADAAFWHKVQENALLFPAGLDFVFAAAARLAALPRSMTVSLAEHV